jgi:hypothetical protein
MLTEEEKKAQLAHLNPIQKLKRLYEMQQVAREEHDLAVHRLKAHKELRKQKEEISLFQKYAISPEEQRILDVRHAKLKKEKDERKRKLHEIGQKIKSAAVGAERQAVFVGQQSGKLASAVVGRPDIYRKFERSYRTLNPYSRHRRKRRY